MATSSATTNTTATPATGVVGGAMTQPATFRPVERRIDPKTETAAGQVDSLLSKDSPLMQRARTLAMQNMNQRGLVNSSMAQGAGVAAMVDKITPIALQDAQTYNDQGLANQKYVNEGGMFNVGEQNKFGLQKNDQTFTATENNKGRTFATSERVAGQEFESGQNDLDRTLRTDLQKDQQSFTSNENDLDRTLQTDLQKDQQSFTADLAKIDRDHQTSLVQLQNDLSKSGVSTAFASNLQLNTSNAINTILADPNIKPDAKKIAIQNVIDAANATLAWASDFYNTPMPSISGPDTPPDAGDYKSLVKELLGRDISDAALQKYLSEGTSLQQVRENILKSPEYLRRQS